MYTALPVLIGALESKITMLTSVRSAMLREWRLSGDDTHRRFPYVFAGKYTGVAHGWPASSAVARVLYTWASTIARAMLLSSSFACARSISSMERSTKLSPCGTHRTPIGRNENEARAANEIVSVEGEQPAS